MEYDISFLNWTILILNLALVHTNVYMKCVLIDINKFQYKLESVHIHLTNVNSNLKIVSNLIKKKHNNLPPEYTYHKCIFTHIWETISV